MIDFFEKTKGSISLFLALIMLPMMTVAGLIVDGVRISAAKASLSGAGDLAMNAALSEYDQILYDVYGIFAVSENMEELQNNVSRYFANSIDNTGILNDSDSYTREFINSIFSSFSGDEMEFNNIVDLKADRFTLQGVESSAIGNPKVLERQIVDYMKYRGPINIGKGLLTKLGCIGETSKQTKAIEAKVNYDQKLDTVQDACKEAYKAINEYNDLIGGNSKFASNEYLNQLSQDIDSAKKDVADMVKYLVAYNSSELNVPPLINERPSSLDSLRVIILKDQWAIFKVDSATRKEVESYYKKSKAANRELDTMAYIEGKLAERGIKVVPVENGDYGIDFGINYDEKMLKLEITQSTDLGKEIGYYIDVKGNKKLVGDNTYQYLGSFGDGLAPAQRDGKYGYIDTEFHEQMFELDYAGAFANGVAAVKKGDKWALINCKLKNITDFTYDEILVDSYGYCSMFDRITVRTGDKYFFVDHDGKQIGATYDGAAMVAANDGYAAVKVGSQWGFADAKGELVIQPQYENARSFSLGLAPVEENDRWGYINTDGELVVEEKYFDAGVFSPDGAACVKSVAAWSFLVLCEYDS